jgi:uncharacterized protein
MNTHEIESSIRNAVWRELNPDHTFLFLFGSRALGNARPGSDYDVGVYTGKPVPWSSLSKIKGQIEDSAIPVPVDIVDFSEVSEDFRKVALKGAQFWHRPKNGLTLT